MKKRLHKDNLHHIRAKRATPIADPISFAKKKRGRPRIVAKNAPHFRPHQIKQQAANWFEESAKKFNDTQEILSEYAQDLAKSVKKHPLTSVLIAGGIGFIVSSFLRK